MAQKTQEIALNPGLLARAEVQALTPYQSARRIVEAAGGRGDIWLNANESAEAVPYDIEQKILNRYPDAQPEEVVERYARYAGVGKDQILVTRGGDEGIDLLVRTFCVPGRDAIVQFPPTYGMYSVCAETTNVRVVNLTTSPENNWAPDTAKLAETLVADPTVQVVFACSPNNPTGGLLSPDTVEELVEITRGRAILVIDEAYIEFAPESTNIPQIAMAPHVVIIRTLSKAFALAGIRCGFLISSPEVIGMLKKVIAPYPIPTPVSDIAAQALSMGGISAMQRRVQGTIKRRADLAQKLLTIRGVEEVRDSSSNFVLVKFTDGPAVFKALWDSGIIVRDQGRQPTLTNCIRITVGTLEENAELIEKLREVLGER
ncbi:histidinol-phosphate transaminase [Sutterella sp.]|uniref:histidinol-phosphate transaminase n=1 Tax=Sutterella sp. TaxID=1981025 RepID=UPI0026DF95CA|nr:histidinol-phosphate transaminase [Sutterella sp.]MDO5531215.1 histidinol-phosphate transaminase [Sutterella sp.]